MSRGHTALAAGPREKGSFFTTLASEAHMSPLGVSRDKTCFLCQTPRKCGGAEAALRWLFWEAGDKRGAGDREPDRISWGLACPLRGGWGTEGAPGGVGVPPPL